jgi:hypothetical protein
MMEQPGVGRRRQPHMTILVRCGAARRSTHICHVSYTTICHVSYTPLSEVIPLRNRAGMFTFPTTVTGGSTPREFRQVWSAVWAVSGPRRGS